MSSGTQDSVSKTLLKIDGLVVSAPSGDGGEVSLVEGVSLEVRIGETVGLVGESGCGKSATAFAILDLLPSPLRIASGTITFAGQRVANRRAAGALRGRQITMVFQEPAEALNPVITIGSQLREVIARNRDRSLPFGDDPEQLLSLVNVPSPKAVLRRYPFQLSGGMIQRVMIAMAIAPGPALVIADEPTTALDRTTQVEIIDLFGELTERLASSVLFISHDISLLGHAADRIAVMYAGRIVEEGPTEAVLCAPVHPYTRGLLACLPGRTRPGTRLTAIRGTVPSPDLLPSGCPFRDRCEVAEPSCAQGPPPSMEISPDHRAACPVSVLSGRTHADR